MINIIGQYSKTREVQSFSHPDNFNEAYLYDAIKVVKCGEEFVLLNAVNLPNILYIKSGCKGKAVNDCDLSLSKQRIKISVLPRKKVDFSGWKKCENNVKGDEKSIIMVR
jgi:hypothetical protein